MKEEDAVASDDNSYSLSDSIRKTNSMAQEESESIDGSSSLESSSDPAVDITPSSKQLDSSNSQLLDKSYHKKGN